ncbi:MAG: pyridoxamine 5'-phosphate oxidase family protein [Cyclobacteriaceae bacterium]|nr:pyridoxamine 5'-phosphate oxidase family protein [Cyclobacteriaceae bacterium]
MDVKDNWVDIRKHFNKAFRSNFYVSIASVDEDNKPTVTPIGSLFLNRDQTGYYFEKYPQSLPRHAEANPNICALAVNSSVFFWLKSLFRGKFKSSPAIKLYGVLENRRPATPEEIIRLQKRMRATRGMKGNTYLWGDMQCVRDIRFDRAESVKLGEMTSGLS